MAAAIIGYLEKQRGQVRPDNIPRTEGFIELPEYEAIKGQVLLIARWAKARYSDRFRQAPFAELFTADDYDEMVRSFIEDEYAPSSVAKLVSRFWSLTSWASNPPFSQTLNFDRSKVEKFGSLDARNEWVVPSVEVLKSILASASLRFRTMIWMAIGCGFGNDDVAKVMPLHFDAQDYDMRRGRTGVERSGTTPPLLWAHIQAYLKNTPREANEILFIGKTGKPLIYTRRKTEFEMKHGTTTTRKPGKSECVKVDAIRSGWERLLVDAGVNEKGRQGFNVLRHIGRTAAAQRMSVVYGFMGHTGAKILHRCMKALRPSERPTIEWVNRCLQSRNINVWAK